MKRSTTCFCSHRNNAKARAFTLLELLLVIVIIIMLAVVVWPNMSGRKSAVTLKEKADQLAAMMMFGRSGAMSTGCTYRCMFELKGTKAVLESENDPLQKPGEFEAVEGSWAKVNLGENLITCQLVQFNTWDNELKEEEANLLENDSQKNTEDETSTTLPPILFYPDGTSDSAEVLLCDAENNYFTLRLNGLTGEVMMERGNKVEANGNTKTKK